MFEGLIAGSVPIYRGTDNISKFLPAGSYIDANNLGPSELAKLVLKLASDEKAYNKYFEFKKLPIAPHFVDIASMSYSHPNALCRLCEYYTKNYQWNLIIKLSYKDKLLKIYNIACSRDIK